MIIHNSRERTIVESWIKAIEELLQCRCREESFWLTKLLIIFDCNLSWWLSMERLENWFLWLFIEGEDGEISRYQCNLMGFVFAFQTFDSKPIQNNYYSFLLWARTTKRNERSLSASRIVMASRRIRFSFFHSIPSSSKIEDFYEIASCDTHTHRQPQRSWQ